MAISLFIALSMFFILEEQKIVILLFCGSSISKFLRMCCVSIAFVHGSVANGQHNCFHSLSLALFLHSWFVYSSIVSINSINVCVLFCLD